MSAKLLGMMLGLIFGFPAYLAARHRKAHQDARFGRQLADEGELTAELVNAEAGLHCRGRIVGKDGRYQVEVVVTRDGMDRRLAHAAGSKDEIERFLEAHTPLRMGDFYR